jgi:hypothetical protein
MARLPPTGHPVARRRQRLQEEHPQVGHEIARDTIIGAEQQNFHG